MARIKKIATELQVKDKLLDYSGDAGTSGQLLSSTGTGTNWITFSGVTASNGANTRVAFFTGSTTIEGSNGLYWDNSNARLGIGTTSPQRALEIRNGSGVGYGLISGTTGAELRFRPTNSYSTNGNFGIEVTGATSSPYTTTMNFTGFHSNETTVMTLKGTGNVGIGTTSPGVPLDVNGIIRAVAGDATTSAYSITSNGGDLVLKAGADDIVLRTGGSGTEGIYFQDGAQDTKMFINAENGNVGIGTTSPGVQLDVFGANGIRATVNSSALADGYFAQLHSDYGANALRLTSRKGDVFRASNYGQDVSILTGNPTSERIRVTSAGDVGIGTTSPSSPLHVYDTTSDRIAVFESGDNKAYIQISDNDTTGYVSSENGLFSLGRNAGVNANNININASHNVGIGTTSPSKTLHVYNSNDAPLRVESSDATSGIQFKDNGGDNALYYVGATDHFYTTAKLGIGATSPARNLHIHENDSTLSYIQITNDTTGAGGSDGVSFGITSDEVAIWNNRENTDTTISTNNTERMRITSGGNVGIGTSSPSDKLEINGNIKFGDSHFIGDDSFDNLHILASSGENVVIQAPSGNSIDLKTAGGSTLNLDSSQNATFAGDVTVSGNLTVNGTTTTINTATVEVEDNILQLNTTQGSPDTATATTSGISVYRGNGVTQASLIFDDADDTWDLTNSLAVASNVTASGNVIADKIGINKSSPTGRLHINQTADNQGIIIESGSVQPEIEFRDTATGDSFSIGHNRAASQLAIEVDGTDKYVFTDGGRFGINTTSPSSTLSVISDQTGVARFVTSVDRAIVQITDEDTTAYIGVKDNIIGIGSSATPTDNSTFKINVTNNTAAFGLGTNANDKFRIRQTFNTSDDTSNNGLFIDYNASGTDALTADRNAIALRVDMDSTATGGNQSQELTMYGGYFDVIDDGDANHLYGMYAQAIARKTASNDNQSTVHAYKGLARAAHTAGQVNQIVGGEFIAQTDNNGGTINELNGVKGLIQNTSDAGIDVGTARAGLFKVDITGSSNDPVYTTVYGVDSEIEMDETTTINNAFVNFSRVDANAGTITSAYLYRGTYNIHSNATVTDKYGIYLDGSARNYIQGSMNLGGTGNYNQGVPLAVKAVATNTAEVLTKIWDGGTFAFSIDRSSTNTNQNTELYRLGLNYNNNGAANGYIGFFRGTDGTNGYLTLGTSNTERMRIDASGNTTFGGKIYGIDGAAGTPSYSFDGFTDDGMYREVYDTNKSQISFATEGTRRARVNEAGIFSDVNVYAVGDFRSFSDPWHATQGTSGAGFRFENTTDSNILLDIDGSGNATFAGDINGDKITLTQGAYTDGYRLIRSGHDTYRIALGDSQGLQIINETDSNRKELMFHGNGNATFAGNVYIDGDDIYLGDEETRIKTYSTYLGIFAAGGSAKNVKARSLTLTTDFNDSAPTNGLYVKGNANFGGSITGKDSGIIIDSISGPYGRIHGTSSIFLGGSSTTNVQLSAALIPDADSTRSLGSSSRYWSHGYIDAITTTGNITVGGDVTLSAGDIILNDSNKLKLGNSGAETSIYSDGTDTYIQQTSGNLYLYQGATNKDIIFYCDKDDTDLEIARFDGSDQGLKFKDGKKIIMGDSGDIQIQSDNSNQLFDFYNLSNVIFRQHFLDGDMTFQSDDGSGGVTTYFKLDGGAEQVIFSKDIKTVDNVNIKIGGGGDLRLYHNGTNSNIENFTGTLQIIQNLDDGDISFKSDNGSGGTTEYFRLDGGDENVRFSKNVKFSDSVHAVFGNGADLKIYHNGTDSYIDDAGTGDLRIRSNFLKIEKYTGETMATFNDDNAVTLYYNNSAKLSTTDSGISVTNGITLGGTVQGRTIPYVIHTGWGDDTSTTANKIIPLGNSVTEQNVSAADGQHFFIAPYNGKVQKIIMKNVAGTLSSSFTTELKLYINGVNVTSSGELTASSNAITWEPSSSNTFNPADTISLVYQKSASSKYWREVALTMVLTMNGQDI
jgi:hypothetical protein